MPYTKRIDSLPTTPSSQRILQTYHIDDNLSMLETFLSGLCKAVFATGGYVLPGIQTIGTTTIRIQNYWGVTWDGLCVVRIADETLSVSGITVGVKCLLCCDTSTVTTNRSYVDPVSGNTITEPMVTNLGKLYVVKATDVGVTLDAEGYPALTGATPRAPILRFYRDTSSHITTAAGGSVVQPLVQNTATPMDLVRSVHFSWVADGDQYFVADQPYSIETVQEQGTGTLTITKSTDGTTFSAAAAPYTLLAGHVLKLSVSGLSGYKAVTLKDAP